MAGLQITGFNETVSAEEAKLFTNSLGCDLEHLFKMGMESQQDKQRFEKDLFNLGFASRKGTSSTKLVLHRMFLPRSALNELHGLFQLPWLGGLPEERE